MGLSNRGKICIFDLDGVLFDVSERLAIARQASRDNIKIFWDVFLREDLLDLDKPRRSGIEALLRCKERGYQILILTGRPERLLWKTIEQLSRIGLPLDQRSWLYLVMRPSNKGGAGNPYRPPIKIPRIYEKADSRVFKLSIIDRIAEVYEIIEIHEDDEDILKQIWKRYPGVDLYIHTDDTYKKYKGRDLLDYSGKTTSS